MICLIIKKAFFMGSGLKGDLVALQRPHFKGSFLRLGAQRY